MNRPSHTVIVCLACLAGAALLRADDKPWVAPARAAAKKNPVPPSAAAVEAGKKVFAKECLSCHGSSGKGDGPKAAELKTRPRDLSTPEIASQSDGALYWKLNEGRIPMPKFDELLSEEQRWQVIHFLRTLGTAGIAKTATEPGK